MHYLAMTIRKTITLLSFVLLASLTAYGQSDKGFAAAQDENWLVDLDEAYKLSKETDKPILANFTGSDWCGWCKRLRAEVFSQPEFKKWAEENVILLELDFPRRKAMPAEQIQQNRGLQQAFRVTGFPTIWLFSMDKKEGDKNYALIAYGKTGYLSGGATNFTKQLDRMIANKK